MKKTFLAMLIGLNLAAGLELARAQTDEVPVPKAPYLAPVPDYGHWKVTFKYRKAETPAAPSYCRQCNGQSDRCSADAGASACAARTIPASDGSSPTSIETIKTGDLRGVTLTFADGTSKEFTCQGDWILNWTRERPPAQYRDPQRRFPTGIIPPGLFCSME